MRISSIFRCQLTGKILPLGMCKGYVKESSICASVQRIFVTGGLLVMWRFVIFLTLLNSIRKRCNIYLHFYNFSTMKWHVPLKAFCVDDKHPCILNVQCHHCWLSGDAMTIASATMILTRFSGIPKIKFNRSFTHFLTIPQLHHQDGKIPKQPELVTWIVSWTSGKT